MLPLPVQLTPPNLPHQEPVAASLLRHCFSQTRDRQTPWTQSPHKRRGMALAKPPSLFFNVQNAEKNRQVSILFILPKFPQRYFAKISCKIFRQNLMNDTLPKYPERYFAKIFRKIFCQNIPPDILPEYPTRYFARISRKIFCQNIPPNILPEYPAKYFGKNLPTYPTRYLAKIATRILRRQSASPLLVHIKSLPGAMVSPGPSPSERVPAMIKIAFKAMHSCSLLSGIRKTC